MGYDLENDCGDTFRFRMMSWRPLLNLAEIGGWIPAGTESDDTEWDRTYYSNDGQTVTAADALALARGLEVMLDDIPDVSMRPHIVEYTSMVDNPVLYNPLRYEHRREDYGIPPEEPITILRFDQWEPGMPIPTVLVCRDFDDYRPTPMEYWSGGGKQYIRDFIEFCRNGAFQIY